METLVSCNILNSRGGVNSHGASVVNGHAASVVNGRDHLCCKRAFLARLIIA